MAYISKFTGKEVDDILEWAVDNKGIQIVELWDGTKSGGPTTRLSASELRQYDLVFVHGYVEGSRVPNQGMLVFDPRLIEYKETSGPSAGHGVYSTTVFRGTPGAEGAPIAIEVFLEEDNGTWIKWEPCYDIGYDGGTTYKRFLGQYIVGIRSINPYES